MPPQYNKAGTTTLIQHWYNNTDTATKWTYPKVLGTNQRIAGLVVYFTAYSSTKFYWLVARG